ncbi:Hypothetical Protein RSKD131_0469 [Cereibacter sphaeroides KD131]|nr:Hypothetical Protein RSKD131_0469 [Cereibacter sphaeroides KD131]
MRAPRRVQASGRTRPTVRQTRPGLQQSPHRPRTLPALPPSLRPASPRPGSAVRPIRPPFPFDKPASSPPASAACRSVRLLSARLRRPSDPASRLPARRASRFRRLPAPPAAPPPSSATCPIRPPLLLPAPPPARSVRSSPPPA